MEIFKVADVDEAIELAQQLQAEGRYDWFRGQVEAWPADSSLMRLQRSNPSGWEAQFKPLLRRLFRWISETPGLESIANDPNAFFAIAQHHSIATHLIDFSTDPAVAGFFAADSRTQVAVGTTSCIYCLERADLEERWESSQIARREAGDEELPDIKFITPHVPNLWRMQAQRGVFLECSTNWDAVYPMDRIEFPYTGYPSYPTREAIYPSRRSSLELLLDQFFDNETKLRSGVAMREFLTELQAAGSRVHFSQAQPHPNFFVAEAFKGGQLPEHESWKAADDWLHVIEEHHADVNHLQMSMLLNFQLEPAALLKRARAGFEQALRRNADARRHAVHWLVQSGETPLTDYLAKSMALGLDRLWDGMRGQPFKDLQLAHALATWVCLGAAGYADKQVAERQKIATSVFGEPVIQVEFGSANGASSRGWVSVGGLRAAVRSDLDDWWADKTWQETSTDVRKLLQICYSPSRLFDFERLLELFASQLGPTQLNRSEPYFLHPARLRIFGLP